MTTIEIIKILCDSMDSEYIQENDNKIIDLLGIAANKLKELQCFVDNMLGDHYIDYLEFYTNRCRELEEKQDIMSADIIKLALSSEDPCEYCKHQIEGLGKKCKSYVSGTDVLDKENRKFDWQWSCLDFNYGECDLLMNTPCNGCIKNNYGNFEYEGV